jgi:nitrogen fixation protein NifU and related proteins
MSDVSDLYQELILDHGRKPRNFRTLEGGAEAGVHRAEGHNPLCGDRVKVFVRMAGGEVQDAAFQGAGCAISTASASLMTDAVKGRRTDDVRALFDRFHGLVTGDAQDEGDLGKLAAFSGVSEFPMRVKCATLAWHTLIAALDDLDAPVTTE